MFLIHRGKQGEKHRNGLNFQWGDGSFRVIFFWFSIKRSKYAYKAKLVVSKKFDGKRIKNIILGKEIEQQFLGNLV